MTLPARKRGRPKSREDRRRSVALLGYFTTSEAEAMCALSRDKRRSISDLIRLACRKALLDRRGARVTKS